MEERRSLPRWQINSSSLYKVLGKETSMSGGLLQDINLIGAKLYLKGPTAVRSRLQLEIKIPDKLIPIFTEGEVIWQSSPKSMGFPTGIRFTRFKPADKERILNYFKSEIKQNWW